MPRRLVLGPPSEEQESLRLHPQSDPTGLGNLPAPQGDGSTLPRLPLSSGLGWCWGDDWAGGGSAWRVGRREVGTPLFTRVLKAGTAYLSRFTGCCPPSCTQGQEAAEEPGERADIPVQRVASAALAGTAFWVNIVLGFSLFLFKQALPSPGHITLNKASQCC